MSNKPGFAELFIEVSICFVPVTLIWVTAIFMIVSSNFSSVPDTVIFIPFIIILLLGGIGLIGLYQIMNHIYQHGYQPANPGVYKKIYTGIISLLIGMLCFGLSIVTVVFILPIICSRHLIKLTKENQLPVANTLFDDSII